jgi:hypothetical protein
MQAQLTGVQHSSEGAVYSSVGAAELKKGCKEAQYGAG